MPRTILVHLNVTVSDAEDRDAESIARAVWDAFEVGSDWGYPGISVNGFAIVSASAEEV